MMKCRPVWKKYWDYSVQQVKLMIKLSDYLDYLYNEIIQARKRADEKSVLIAKEYASHEYLKFFKAPRYSFPSVKIDIPVKVADIQSQEKYDFKYDEDKFFYDINEKIEEANRSKNLRIPNLTREMLKSKEFTTLVKQVELKDQKLIRNLNDEIKKIDVTPQIEVFRKGILRTQDASEAENNELNNIIRSVIMSNHTLVGSKLNEIYIDPDTTGAEDKDKLFINLHIEMEEEGLRVVTIHDDEGNIIKEEVIFE